MNNRLRKSGLAILGDIPWATHFCQFYQTRQDLADIIIPFLQAGLEDNEFCVWVTSEAFTAEETLETAVRTIPKGGDYIKSGQLEILPYTEWYVKSGAFDLGSVLNGWVTKLNDALEKGYDGVRVTGDTMWLEKKDWKDFMVYESAINKMIEGKKLLVLCTYSLAQCGASEIIDVIVRHESALIRKEGVWEIIETEEQKRVSRSLKQSEELARNRLAEIEAYYHDAPVGLCVLDRDLRFSRINQRLAEINGLDVSDHLGRTVDDVMPALAKQARRISSQIIATGRAVENVEFVGETLSRPGVVRTLLESWHPLTNGDRDIRGFSVVVEDITDRREVEENLKRHAERLRLISATASNLLETEDPQGIVEDLCRRVMEHLDCQVFFNYLIDGGNNRLRLNAYAGIPDHAVEDIRSLDFGAAVCGCAARDACRIVAEHIQTRTDPRTDLVRSFGVKAYAAHPLFARGKVIGTLSFGSKSKPTFAEDELSLMKTVSDQVATAMERKRLLQATEERAAKLESEVHERNVELRGQADLLDLTHDAIYVRDPAGRIIFWNKGATDTYGWTSQEAMGRISNELLNTIFPLPLKQISDHIVDQGHWEGEIRQTTRDGRQLILASRWTGQMDESGRLIRILVTNNDITGKKQIEQQFRQSQKMDALGTLTGGIAHDFNNILAAIIGFAEIAQNKVSENAAAEKALKRIFDAGIRGRELVRQMLTFSRKTEQEKKPLQLSNVLKETMKLIRASLPSTVSINVEVKSESGLIFADPVQVQQVIMNLCTNAAFAMRERGGVLNVELEDFSINGKKVNGLKPGLYMRLVVSDTGTGINPKDMDKIFDPFFTTKKQGEGTGLGLSVVHGIVRHHDGHIKAESEPGKGARFTVYLPKIKESGLSENALDEGIASGHEHILFVDDEEALVEMGRDLLADLGYQVTAMTDSREALALIRLDPSQFDLVLTDQTMPGMTGIELAREIMILKPDMPVILSTGFSHLVDAEKAKEAGISVFALKPLTKKEIAKTVRAALDKDKRKMEPAGPFSGAGGHAG